MNKDEKRKRANKSACPWCGARDGFKNFTPRIKEMPEDLVQMVATVLFRPNKIAKALTGEEGEAFRCISCDGRVKYCLNCDRVNRDVGELQKCRGCKRQVLSRAKKTVPANEPRSGRLAALRGIGGLGTLWASSPSRARLHLRAKTPVRRAARRPSADVRMLAVFALPETSSALGLVRERRARP